MIDVHPFDRARKQFYGHGASAIELAHGWRGAVFLVTRSLTTVYLHTYSPDYFQAHHPGFLTHVRGSWLKPLVGDFRRDSPFQFSSPSDSSPSGPITLRVPDSCAGFRTHLRGSRFKPLVGDSRRDSPLQFLPPLVIPLLQAPSPLGFLTHVRGSDSFAGFPTQTSGWRLSSWLTVAVFTPLVIPLLQAPSPLGFLTHVRGSGLICGVPDSNLWLATLVVTHRCSFHLP